MKSLYFLTLAVILFFSTSAIIAAQGAPSTSAASKCSGSAVPDGQCQTGTAVSNCRCTSRCTVSGTWYCETQSGVKIQGSGGSCKGDCAPLAECGEVEAIPMGDPVVSGSY